MILITGATGHLGTHVIENLLKTIKPENIVAFARDKKKAEKWSSRGLSVRIGDFDNISSLEDACVGVEKLLLVPSNDQNALGQHKNVIDAAIKNNVRHIYYASGSLNHYVEASQLGPLNDSYSATENYLKQSGADYTILQNCLYAETIPFFIGRDPINQGIYFPAGNGKCSFALREEMGEAIAKVIASEGHVNATYMLTGQQTYSFNDIATILGDITGKEISYYSPDENEYENQLREYGVSEGDIWFSSIFAAIIKNTEYDIYDLNLERLLGRKPTTLQEFLRKEYAL